MVFIAEQKLQRMLARRQRDGGFRLPLAVMDVMLVFGNSGIQIRNRGIDEQMMMPAVRLVGAGRNDVDALGAEFHGDRA